MGFDKRYADIPGAVVGPAVNVIDLGSITLADVLPGGAPPDEGAALRADIAARKALAQQELARRLLIEDEATANLIRELDHFGVPAPDLQFRFAPPRRWKFDLAWPEEKLAIELQGLGSHTRVRGFMGDSEKLCTAAALGWIVFPAIYKMAKGGSLVRLFLQCWDAETKRVEFRKNVMFSRRVLENSPETEQMVSP